MSPKPRTRHAHTLFFPAAGLYAAVVLPLSLLSMISVSAWLPGLATSMGHAHEMLFGFALAVISGYLLGPQPVRRLNALFGLWLLARVSYLAVPGSVWAGLANIVFAVLLAGLTAPKFMSAAKKWRNHAIGPILLGLCGTTAGVQISYLIGANAAARPLLMHEAVLLLALLMLFMGGRVIAPAVAGQFHRQGEQLDARVQPHIEGGLIIAMGAAILLSPLSWGRIPAALALAVAGVLAAVRLLRWRVWQCKGRPDLLGLGLGYGWLALGLLALGATHFSGSYRTAALHLVTVGALGSLSAGIMARTHLQRAKLDPAGAPLIVAATLLIAFAALARAGAGLGAPAPQTLLWCAALAWSLAFLLIARLLTARRH